LLARNGTVKVVDFGIAVVTDLDRTMPGGVIPGTLRYLSPEQAQGGEATPASDIWAAGAVLAELLTGYPPLQGAGVDFIERRASEPPRPPSEIDARVPPELDDVVLCACAIEPSDRYADAGEMANALRRVAARSLGAAAPVDSLVTDVTDEIRLPESAPTTRMERRRRRRRGLRLVLWLLLGLLLAGGAAAVGVHYLLPQPTRVPTLVGRPSAEAARAARRAGLRLEVVGRERHFGTRRGEVLTQAPVSGRLLEGSALRVVLSAGLPQTNVPQVVGLPIDDAGTRLRLLGIELGRVTNSYARRPRGLVISQSPAAGKVTWGGAVDVVVSKGPRPVAVASVEGRAAASARKRLERDGLDVVVERAYSNVVRAGRAIGTTPSAGNILPGGSRVVLRVSRGPRFAAVRMPDVTGQSVPAAKAALRHRGLRSRVVPTCPGGSTVVETDPIAGSGLRERDLVALFVC
jgi:beta-lactam-binding protein with PASTA domain